MILSGRSIWWVLLTLCLSSWSLEISQHDNTEVNCLQGLSECTVQDVIPITSDTVDVRKINADFRLNCKDRKMCTLCLVIDIELYIPLDEEESHSGADEEDFTEEIRNVKVCYKTAVTVQTCKKVEFTVNRTALNHQNQAKVSLMITPPDGFPYSCRMYVYPPKNISLKQEVDAPSLEDVCSRELMHGHAMCQVPAVRSVINQTSREMELLFGGRNKNPVSLCIQYEKNGTCQSWNRMTIPLDSVAPCMCFQAWDDQSHSRIQYCPFQKTEFPRDLQQNMWKNVSVHVSLSKMNDKSTMLSWNVSAPCRLEGEVWLCYKTNCKRENDFRQQLTRGVWRQNSKGFWEKKGEFQNIDGQFSQCIMVKVKGMEHEFGPICTDDTGRWRWSLLVVGVILLICLTSLVFYFHHDCVKKWAWSWHLGGFVKVGRKGHVVLLSPPDVDDSVSESVCKLGFFLHRKGFSVTVDQWCRKEQCALGPLPWLHSKLLKLNSTDVRVLLVLTPKALDKTANWTHMHRNEGEDSQLLKSPYSDLFTASLFLMETNKQLGKRFVLVRFDSQTKQCHSSNNSLPPLFHGLPLFHLPSQTQSLLTELTVIKTERITGGQDWTGWTGGT
ncbi:interleukin-17 receptor C-like [Melanotaenia boesemani]|uniref:interleukin-17 receptor C-like n=1 Tax=Melanotaenia boesemani TaxID=1250792 RepID=UPI001C0549FA|nr:interleukin-17 receptor C-like [Melanotaenia boesemani]XP_041837442.1 interleukin-17 receptor C-like [Melanotaenia boesemani]